MANKKDMTMEKLQKAKADNIVVYKVMAALIVMCGCIAALRGLRTYYGTVGGMELLDPLTVWIAVLGFAAFAVCCVLLLAWKNKVARMILPLCAMTAALVCVTGVSMKLFWTQGFSSLYFLCCAMFVQYIVLQLYHWEFFLFSLGTISAGFAFFNYSTGFGWNLWNIVILGLALVVLIAIAVVTKCASKTGALTLGRKQYFLFPSKFNPTLLYLAAALWLACIAASLLLGSLFSYYCMFAAIAVEFIAAVYYTFQLN